MPIVVLIEDTEPFTSEAIEIVLLAAGNTHAFRKWLRLRHAPFEVREESGRRLATGL